ncbi:protein kinase [Aureococcus anophagefferens]|nr:protein kinase [Aureococcus anophagefferens]
MRNLEYASEEFYLPNNWLFFGVNEDGNELNLFRIRDASTDMLLGWFTLYGGQEHGPSHFCLNSVMSDDASSGRCVAWSDDKDALLTEDDIVYLELTENRDNGLCAEVWPEDAAGKSFYGAVVAVAFNSNNDEYVASIYVDGVFTNGVRREWWAAPFEFGVDVCLQINEAHGSFEADWHHSDFCDGSDGACTDSSTFFVCDVAEEACVDAGYTYVPPSFVFDLDGDGLTCCGCAAGCDHSLETADKADCSYFDWDYGSGHDHGDGSAVCADSHQTGFVESFGCGTVCAEHSDKYFECLARNWRGTLYSECDVDCDATYATSDGGSDGGCDHFYPANEHTSGMAYTCDQASLWKKKKQRPDSKVVPTSAAPAKAAPPPAAAPPAKTTLAASAAGAAFTLSATETDVLGPLAGMLTGLGAVAPPPLNCCLYPFTQALAQLAVAREKLDDVVKATAGLPTGRVEAVSRTVDALGRALQDASAFLAKFAKKGAFSKLCSGTLDARTFMLLDKRLCELSGELGSALDLQQLALQTQRFQKIEGLIQLLGQQAVERTTRRRARAALMCGIERGSAVEKEELSELGLKLDKLTEGVGIDKERALEAYEVVLDSCEPEPRAAARARCTAEFQGDVVALKRMSMVGVTAPKRAKMLRDFSTELAIMFLEGGDLRTAIDAEDYAAAVDEAQRRRWLGDVALGMQYLYSKGVEHRDLKTLNVLLDGNRRCKVTDFGLSKSDDLNTAATQATAASGSAKGTPAYMAPELLESNTFTEKTDVYAFDDRLGAVHRRRGARDDHADAALHGAEVPPAQPGMTLQATTPEGTTVQVAIPAGLAPGMRFQVAY